MKKALRLLIAFLIAFPQSLWANPTIGEVVAGAAGISSSGDTTTIIQTSNNAIINWRDFSINQGETTQFIQPSAMSAALNRVTGGNPSAIYGNLNANGKVFLINPNGVTVGPSGVINTQSFVASTLDLGNDLFMAGNAALRFLGDSAASVVNMGRINALGGDVLLIAHTVKNAGEINATQGAVGLAAGSEVLIQPGGDERVFVKAGGSEKADVGVDQAGQIKAATAELKAAGGNVYSLAINNSGLIQATGVERRGGRVYLVAEGGDIALKTGSVIDASGENGGGTVLVGGDTEGLNPDVPNASKVVVEEGAQIKADATVNGDGGKVVVWGNDATSFRGTISAKGGAEGGNGGNAEVSGAYLDYSGYADLTAANGLLGGLLLDPIDLVISNAANNNLTGTYTSNGAASNLNVTTLQNQLSGANVTVQTGSGTGGNGDITVSNAVTWSGSQSNRGALTLSAHNNIIVNAALTQTGNGSLTMIANSANSNSKPNASITLNAAVTTAGNQTYTANGGNNGSGIINLNSNVTTTGSGAQTYNNRVVVQNANTTLTSGGGTITFQDTVNGASAGNQSLTIAGSGNVSVNDTIGATTRLGALNVNGTGTASLNGGTVNTGAQTYNKAVTLGTNATLTSNNGAVAFNSTVNGSNALTVNAGSGDVTFGGIVGGTTQLDGLTVTGSGTTNLNTSAVSINGTGNVAFGEKVQLGANTTINTNTGDATFSGTVNGANSLTVNAGNGGNITFSGAVGGVNALTSLNLTGTGTTNLNGGAVTTTGAQSYNEATVLGANTVLNGGPIDFNSTLNGSSNDGQSLTINAGASNISFSNVGTTANRRLASVTVNGTGTVDLNGTVNTGGAQSYAQKIVLSGNSALTTNNAAITLGNTVNGATAGGQSLTLNSGSAATNVNSTIGATTRVGALTFNGATTNLNGGTINSGAEAFNGAVVLGQNTTLNSNGGTVDFNANLNGAAADAQSLTVNAGNGNVSFSNAGTVQRLQSVAVTGTGGLDLNGTINTNGAQSYSQAIGLSGNSVLTTNNAAVTLGGAVNANTADAQSLTINAGNAPVSLASVGVTRRLSSFALNNTGGLTLNGTINTSQAQTYNQAITLAGNSGFSTNNQVITLNGAVDGTTAGGQSLTLNAGSAATNLNSALGGATRLGALTINGSGTTNVNTTTINTGAQTFNQAVNLQQNVTFNSNGGNVAFNGAVNGDVADTRNLTVNAGAGNVNLGNVGTTRRINSLALTAGTIGLNGTVNTNGGQTYSQAVTLNGNSTLQTNNTGITLNGTVNGSNTLTLNAGTGNVSINGAVGNTSALDALTISGTGVTNLNTSSVKTNGTGNQTYGEAVNLLQNTTLTTNGGNVVFAKTVDGAKSLAIDSTATGNGNDGDVTFGGAVGAGTTLSSLIINQSNISGQGNGNGGGSGITYINGGSVNTNGVQTYGDEIIMNANTVLNSNGGAFNFNDHVNGVATGAQGLTVNAGAGNIFFNRRVGGDRALAYLTIGAGTGTTDIDTGGIETTGNQLYGQNVALTNDPDFTTTGGNITFMGTINGGHDILMSPVGGNVVFNGAVGNTTALDSLTISGSGTTNINGGLVRTVNNQSYGENVVLGADTTINATGSGSVAFQKTINGAKNLVVTPNSGNVTFTGAIGDVTHLTSLTVNAGNNNGTTNLNDSVINTDGNQTYGQKVALGGNETLSSNGGNVLFSNTVNGARTLAVNAGAGNVTFSNTVGNTTALTSLGITGTGTTNLNGNSVRTAGNQTYGEKVQLGTDNTLTATTNGAISFSGTVNGARNLTATTGGQVAFNGVVGGNTALTSLTTNGTGGTTNINTTSINTTGAQNYNATTVSQDATLTSVNGPVNFNSTLNAATDGVQSLTVTDGGVTSFNGVVGGVKKLAALTTNGSGSTNINTTAINTTGAQNYNATTLFQNAVLTSVNGPVNFNSTLNAATDGVQSLTVTDGGVTSFNGVVGGVKKLAALTTNGSGSTNINTTAINTTGAQNYNATKVSQNATLTATANGAINLNSTLDAATDGAQSLTATTGGQAAFNGVVGGLNKLASLTTNGSGTTNINTTAINTTGAQNYNATTLSQNAVLTSVNGPVNFNSTLNAATDGVQSLTVTDGGATSFNGVVGGVKKLAALTTNGSGSTNINTTAINTTGAQNYNATTLSQNAALTATANGPISFNSTLDAAAAGGQSLTATSGGNVSFNDVVGGGKKLSSLTTNGLGTTNINTNGVNTTGAQNYGQAVALGADATLSSDAGAVTFSKAVGGLKTLTVNALAGGVNVNGGSVSTLAQTYNGAMVLGNDTTLDANGADVTLNGAVSGLKTLTVNAANANVNGGSVNTSAQTYNAAVVLGNDTTLNANGADVTLNGAVSGLKTLTVNAANANVNGGSVNTSAQTYNGAVVLGNDTTLDANGADVTLNGAVSGLKTLTVNAANANVNGGSVNTLAQTYNAAVVLGNDTILDANGSDVTLNGAVSGLKTLTVNAANAKINGGSVNTAAQTYNAAVVLGNDATLDANGSDITLNGAVSGAHALTANAANININVGSVNTAAQAYNGAVVLGDDTALTSTGGDIALNGSVSGAHSLTTDSSADTTFGGTVDVDSLGATAGGLIKLNGGSVVTSGDQNYLSAVLLGAAGVLTGANASFSGAVDGAQDLTVNAGDVTFGGAVGNGTALNSLTIGAGAGTTYINGGSVTTLKSPTATGDQNYNEAVVLGANTTLTSNDGAVSFAKTVDGAQDLTVNAGAGNVNFFGAVGDGPALASLTIGAGSGTTDINGARVTTTGAQTYGQKVVLSDDAYLKSTNSGAVTFDETVDGTVAGQQGLTVETDGAITFYKDIGKSVALEYLTLIGSGQHSIFGEVHTVGNIDFLDDLFLTSNLNLFSSGGRIWFHKRVNSDVNGVWSLGAHSDGGDTIFGGAIGDVKALNLLTADGWGTIHVDGGSVNTIGAQTYGDVVALGQSTVFTAPTIALGASATHIGAASVTGAGDQTFDGAVQLDSDVTVSGNAVAFNGSVTGAKNLTTSSVADTSFNGAVNVASLDATASNINLNAGTIDTTGAQTYRSAVALTGGNVLTGDTIDFLSTITGANALTTASTLDTSFGGAVNIASLDASAAGINLNDGNVTTSGDQTYNGAVNLNADGALGGDAITVNGSVTGAKNLTTTSVADTTFNGAINVASLDATAAGIKLNGATVDTTGAQTYNGDVALGDETTLTGADVAFNGTVNGAHSLIIDANDITLRDAVGDTTELTSLAFNGTGVTHLDGNVVNTSGGQSYNENVEVGANSTLTSGQDGVNFIGSVNGPNGLTVNAGAGDVTFAAGVGDVTRLASLATGGTGTTKLNLGSAKTTGDQNYGQALSLVADTTLDSTLGDVTFGGAVTGAQTLTVNAVNTKVNGGSVSTLEQIYNSAITLGNDATLDANGADVTLNGAVSGVKALTVNAANVNMNAGTVNTAAQTYNGELNLVSGAVLTSNGGAVAFKGGVNGAQALTVNAGAGDVTFAAGVGDVTRLASLATGGTGTTKLNLGSAKTTGDQNYGQALSLVADTTLDSTLGDVTFGGAVTGAQTLTVNAVNTKVNGGSVSTLEQIYNSAITLGNDATLDANGADVTLNGAVSGNQALTVNAANINMNAGTVNTGAQAYNGDVALGADTVLTSNGGAVTFDRTVNGAYGLTVNAGAGDVGFNGAVGDTARLTSLTIGAGAGATVINGGAITTDGAQSYGQRVVLGADTLLASNGGDVNFYKTVNGTTYGGQGLTVDSAAGDINFWDAIGDVMPLKYLTLLGTGAKNLYGAVNTVGNQDYWNDLLLLNDLIINSHGGNVTFHQTVNGAYKLEVNAESGNIGFYGAIGNLLPLSSLILTGTGLTTLSNGNVTTSGAQSYGQGVFLAADARLASNGGLITFGASWNGAHSLDVNAGAIALNGGLVDALAQTYTGDVTLGADTVLKSHGGDVAVNGAIDGGANALTIDSTDGTLIGGSLNTVPSVLGAGNITLNGPVTAGDVSLSGLDVAWNASLSARNVRIFGRDVLMGGDVATYGDDGVLLVADRSFKNAGANLITPSGLGRWLIYSVSPDNDVRGGLTGSTQWSSTYKNGPLPGFIGNGFLYSSAEPVNSPPAFNFGAINNNPNPFDNGPFGGNHGGSIFEDGGGLAEVEDNGSANSSDLFNWDLGTMRDAVASPDDSDSSTDAKKKKKKKSK